MFLIRLFDIYFYYSIPSLKKKNRIISELNVIVSEVNSIACNIVMSGVHLRVTKKLYLDNILVVIKIICYFFRIVNGLGIKYS